MIILRFHDDEDSFFKDGRVQLNKYVEKCMGQVIVSCQAYEDTPLYGPENMKIMAESVLKGGAKAIRACWPQDIKAIRQLGDFPIIGLNKIIDSTKSIRDQIIITPTFQSAAQVIEAGSNILALDCTLRPFRGKDALYALLKEIKAAYPETAIMADCATLEEGIFAAETGFVDIVSSTLSGMVSENTEGPDINILIEMKKHIDLPINAEGRIWDLTDLKNVLDAGADMITIGTAITRPHLIAERFINYYEKYSKFKVK
jgi:N-acylglucosamine-6-phosphate 2-epimerase